MLTIIAIDLNSSDTTTRTFTIGNDLKSNIQAWIHQLAYYKYELECTDTVDVEVEKILEELEILY